MSPDAAFLMCLPFTLAQECPRPDDWSNARNFSNDAHDPGGATMCGIIQREYDHYRIASGLPTQPVIHIAEDEGVEIYQNSYWLPYCPRLKPGMQLSFFDAAVNEGTTEAVKILQFALNLARDGVWGIQTAAALASYTDQVALINAFGMRRRAVYQEMPGYQYFGKDWTRRAIQIHDQSLKMVGG